MDSDRPAAQLCQVQKLGLRGMDYLQQNDIGRVRKFQVEEVKLSDVRAINPEIVLLAYPLTERIALHGYGSDLERGFPQDLFGQIEVVATFIRPGTANVRIRQIDTAR
jgi:hypothetical protein